MGCGEDAKTRKRCGSTSPPSHRCSRAGGGGPIPATAAGAREPSRGAAEVGFGSSGGHRSALDTPFPGAACAQGGSGGSPRAGPAASGRACGRARGDGAPRAGGKHPRGTSRTPHGSGCPRPWVSPRPGKRQGRRSSPQASRQESLSRHLYFAAFIKNINIKHSLTQPNRPSAENMFYCENVYRKKKWIESSLQRFPLPPPCPQQKSFLSSWHHFFQCSHIPT